MNIYLKILLTVLVFCVISYGISVLITTLSKMFAVKKDERLTMLLDVLPRANCSGCGYGSCRGYANALLYNDAPINKCPVGGNDVASILSELLDKPYQDVIKKRAFVMCSGTDSVVSKKYEYKGLMDCVAVSTLGNGPKECQFGCIGLGTCVRACPFKAIKIENGVAVVEYEKCRACGVCVSACPQNIIKLLPFDTSVWVGCSCQDRGKSIREYCKVGCTACGICEKVCAQNAISISDNIAHIDYDKCNNCGICVEKCPRNIIWSNKKQIETGDTIISVTEESTLGTEGDIF